MNSRIIRLPVAPEHTLFLDTLRAIVGPAHVVTDPAATRSYTTDMTGRWSGRAMAVVRPGSTEEVSAVVATCFDALVPIVPQGGNTGLVGGSAPAPGSITLSTARLNRIDTLDPATRTITAGAGVTVAAADHAATRHTLRFGIDLASRESATLGGIVATNAGGARRIRHGNARAQLLGIEAVLADGSVLSRSSAAAGDNIGYDLPGLLCGSEGTLAVATRVRMRLVEPAPDPHVLLAALDTVDAALRLHDRIRETDLVTEAAELMTHDGVTLVRAHTGARLPFPAPYYALFELSGPRTERSALETLAASDDLLRDAVLAPAPARPLWHLRAAHTEAIGRASRTPPVKLDVALPRPALSTFLDALSTVLTADFPAARPILFGHFAEGCVHVNLLDVAPAAADDATDAVFRLVAEHGGSISAEHGIGRAKAPWVHLGRTPIDVHAMTRLKAALDPRGILNPGVLLPR